MTCEINRNLITLKCVLFLIFGGIGSFLPFLPLHMHSLGFSTDEAAQISIWAPLIACFGPLIVAPLADRLAGGTSGGTRSKTGKYLRVMLTICLVGACIIYWLLSLVPPIFHSPPNTVFVCDPSGGYILQDKCGNSDGTCYQWTGQRGNVLVKNCVFSCNASTKYHQMMETTPAPFESVPISLETITDEYYDDATTYEEPKPLLESKDFGFIPHPHMCYIHPKTGLKMCEVYTEYSRTVKFQLELSSYVEEPNNMCRYPFDSYFNCRITPETQLDLQRFHSNCQPIVVCEIQDPYNNTNSLLRRSQCGYNALSYWLYLVLRGLGDGLVAGIVTLVATAVVIATRETSTGRADVGKQFAIGALGFALFPPLLGGLTGGAFFETMLTFTILSILAAFLILLDTKMPLSPPEWWWHTRCGLLALPMSSVRKYGFEIAALGLVLLLLGVFWNAIDAFLPWHLVRLPEGTPLIIGTTLTIGALPAVLLFVFVERIVDYCSHSNILILCFINYIIHHIALMCITNALILLIFEILEVFTLHLMWITAVLYLRHLVPKKFTSCGQALPVLTHFCLGRCIGGYLGSLAYVDYPENFNVVHRDFAVAAVIIAVVYFVCYHFYLKPKCAAPPQLPPYPAPTIVQSMSTTGNGSYTPLRVYHNGRAKKGHFRY